MAFGNENCKQIVECVCPYCNMKMNMNLRSFANHVRWCKSNPKYKDILNSTVQKIRTTKANNKKLYIFTCEVCGSEYSLYLTENQYNKKRYKKTCSAVCAKKLTAIHSDKSKNDNISKGLQTSEKIHHKVLYEKECEYCKSKFKTYKSYVKFCSNSCAANYRSFLSISNKIKNISSDYEQIKLMKHEYTKQCKFKFNLASYKDEFDFDLISQQGWYKPINHGNNLTGISRDHMVSIMEGFNNLVDPYIISHPANCQLLIQIENSKKRAKSSLSIDDLKLRIKDWNKKYGVYPNSIDYSRLALFGLTFEK